MSFDILNQDESNGTIFIMNILYFSKKFLFLTFSKNENISTDRIIFKALFIINMVPFDSSWL